MVSPLSPEVRQGILRVINYLEDTYGVIVKPVIFYQVASIFSFQKFDLKVIFQIFLSKTPQ